MGEGSAFPEVKGIFVTADEETLEMMPSASRNAVAELMRSANQGRPSFGPRGGYRGRRT
jgi:hypothetical protein